jgi:membrane-associated phospholipid phosphatase
VNKIAFDIKQNKIFFFGFIIIMIAGILLLLIMGKEESFILFNTYHPFYFNFFFVYYTYVGNGLFATGLAIICLLLKKKRLGLTILYAFISSGILTQIIKPILNSPRPKLYFGNTGHDYFIKGIDFANNNSFPSGHTATAFAVATTLVLIIKNKKIQAPLLFAAFLVGFSRIYLGQHFLLDVLVGAFVGVACGIACTYFTTKSNQV